MRWLQTEYILKGIFLGLMFFAALLMASVPAERQVTALLILNGCALAGLALALVVAGVLKLIQGYRPGARLLAFTLFLLLESPWLVYAGILAGMLAGILLADPERLQSELLAGVVFGGAVVGIVFGMTRQVRDKWTRLGLVMLLAAGLVVGGMILLLGEPKLGQGDLLQLKLVNGTPQEGETPPDPGQVKPTPHPHKNITLFMTQLLLGIPFFYLLTFAGQEEESEIEIGLMCAALSLALTVLLYTSYPQLRGVAWLLPLGIYVIYTWRILPGLRVYKHTVRGWSYAGVRRHRQALQSFRRALALNPNDRLAREGFWAVHKSLDLDTLANDPQTLALVDLDLCLERARTLLERRPSPAQAAEAARLLELVQRLQPAMQPAIDYWRCVAHAHAGDVDASAAELTRIIDPQHYGRDNPHRRAVLLRAWMLAMVAHPGLRERVGVPQLAHPGRRMEAISAVERHLAVAGQDEEVWGLKRVLYSELTEAEYNAVAEEHGIPENSFDHGYVQQLGLALVNDDAKWTRGGEYLRMAAHGLPSLGPSIFVQIAKAQQRAGHEAEALHNFELAKRAGRSVGPKNLQDPERHAYFATVKYLGEMAMAREDVDAAIENFRLYSESERSGIETLRTLADLYERKGDPLAALRVNEQALQYNGKDPDLLERKDRYYYSVMPEVLQANLEAVREGFDLDYCLRKSKTILDGRYEGQEWLDVAQHMARLALVIRPDSLVAKLLLARAKLRLGERDEAVALLEDIRAKKPESFASGDEEDAWYVGSQLLGDLYMELGRADLSLPCYQDFRKSSKSGARTYFKMAQAYEMLGDRTRALKCYEQVAAYEGNPLAPDAQEAIWRLQSQPQQS